MIRDETPVVGRALEFARRFDHPVYDCIYLAMAEGTGDLLVTADARFTHKVVAGGFARMVELLT